eukprot:gene6100-2698_t
MVFNLFNWGAAESKAPAQSAPAPANPPPKVPNFAAITTQNAPAPKNASDKKGAEPAAPHPSSVFEFGPTVTLGKPFMRGMCTGDDPDAIHACTWSIEAVDPQSNGKTQPRKFRVEF